MGRTEEKVILQIVPGSRQDRDSWTRSQLALFCVWSGTRPLDSAPKLCSWLPSYCLHWEALASLQGMTSVLYGRGSGLAL